MEKSIVLFLLISALYAAPQYYCTAASSSYFEPLLNLIGSLHATNFEEIFEIAIFDLGLTPSQRLRLSRIEKVSLHTIENPGPLRDFAWKPRVIARALEQFPYVLWLDAGTTVLQPLTPFFDYLETHPYFLCTIGEMPLEHSIGWSTTARVREYFQLSEDHWILHREPVMAGIIGLSRSGQHHFLQEWSHLPLSLFAGSRPEQTLLSILAYSKSLSVFSQDPTQRSPTGPCYITWDSRFLAPRTHLYSSRGDLRNFSFYLYSIRWKEF